MRRNPAICLLIAVLMVVSLTGQAAAAFRMACEGTSACCCKRMMAMADMSADRAPMDEGCCATPIPQPCDLSGPAPSSAAPFLPTEVSSERDIASVPAGNLATSAPGIDGGASQGVPKRPPFLADPPIYLQLQSFLC